MMRRLIEHVGAAVAVTLAVLGVGIPVATASAQSKPMPRETHRAVRLVLVTCTGRAVERPRTFSLSCGNDADSLRGMRWSAWGPGRAVARGTQRIDSCLPRCARGRTASYPVAVLLSGSERMARHPRERRYTTITLRYLGKHPAGVGRQVTGALWP